MSRQPMGPPGGRDPFDNQAPLPPPPGGGRYYDNESDEQYDRREQDPHGQHRFYGSEASFDPYGA